MKRIVALFLIVIIVLSLQACGEVSAKGDKVTTNDEARDEILFNDILWGTTYPETTAVLKAKYGVDFVGSDDLLVGEDALEKIIWDYELKCSINGYRDDTFEIGKLDTGFWVISTSAVKVAGEDAYIFLKFAFPNDGETVFNDNFDDALFDQAMYLFDAEEGNSYEGACGAAFLEKYSIELRRTSSEQTLLYKKLSDMLLEKYGARYKVLDLVNDLDIWGSNSDILMHLSTTGYSGDHQFYINSTVKVYGENAYRERCSVKGTFLRYNGEYDYTGKNQELLEKKIQEEYNAREIEYLSAIKNTDSNGL